MIVVRPEGVSGHLAEEIARLESLTADLEQLALGRLPSPEAVAAAPLIDCWAQGLRSEPCLIGQMQGHPLCRGPVSVTSGLWVWAPELGWARTLSRFSRLGRPLEGGRGS